MDTKYLWQRGRKWFVRVPVPQDLRHHFGGTRKLVRALGTSDLVEAQQLRWAFVSECQTQFRRLTEPLSAEDIERRAEALRASVAADLTKAPAWDGPSAEDERRALHAISIDHEQDLDVGTVPAEIAEAIAGMGLNLDTKSEAYRKLAEALTRARVAAFDERVTALGPQRRNAPTATAAPRHRRSAHGRASMTFSAAAAAFLDEVGGTISKQVVRKHKVVYRQFQDFAGDVDLDAVDRGLAADFLATVKKLSPKWGQSPRDRELPLHELLKKFGKGPGLNPATVNKITDSMSALFRWAIKRGKLVGANPWHDQRYEAIASADGNEDESAVAFTDAELKTIFAGLSFEPAAGQTLQGAMAWACRIALYSGMRTGEVAQLRAENLLQMDGVWCLRVAAGNGRRVKTAAGRRDIPVHSAVLPDLLRYHKRVPKDGLLFPGFRRSTTGDKKYGKDLAGAFTRYLRRVGIKRDGCRFYSFRKTFATACENAHVPLEPFLGHSRGFSKDTYSSGFTVERLRELIERIRFPV
jgi:integrase